MYRLLRIVLLLLVSLDVAFFPFSCRGNRDQNKVYIHIMTEQQDEEGNLYYDPSQVYPKLHRTFSNFRIGDTITELKGLEYSGVPSFSPEHFAEVVILDPMKRKQLQKGLY